ncbi:hypothetical protein ANO11243_037190 [Dothideomycetidae sp. 11243]|nr:hypothetical protein ANO11243_037190 [fungal sp. No.11243]
MLVDSEGTADESLGSVRVLLLKTKSIPTDAYEEYFNNDPNVVYQPEFIPVMQHKIHDRELDWLEHVIRSGCFTAHQSNEQTGGDAFGGIIFTSQRAVEAFSRAVSRIEQVLLDSLFPETVALYVVGPATANAVRAINLRCPVIGEHTGNGDLLADFILATYPKHTSAASKMPLLFLVGEQRRDIIPRKLQSEDLSSKHRIQVVERAVYGTEEREQFGMDFAAALQQRRDSQHTWVVVFSPTGCGAMLRALGWLDGAGRYSKALAHDHNRPVRVATIGPTTRDHLLSRYGYEPCVCADKPSPEGVGQGIARYSPL